jgi:hypothetical protein
VASDDARLDEIIRPKYCFKRSPEASLLYMTDGKKDLYMQVCQSVAGKVLFTTFHFEILS